MNVIEYLNKNIKATIDRKMESKHPKYGFNKNISNKEIEALVEFQERFF